MTLLGTAYEAWLTDTRRGLASLIITSTEHDARAINTTARTARVRAGEISPSGGVRLRDGTTASVGDTITRRSDRNLTTNSDGYVKNGDRWTIAARTAEGGLVVTHDCSTTTLPREYVADDVQLGYAITAYRAQGLTVDIAHLLVDDTTTREALYVGATRARQHTQLYVTDQRYLDLEAERPPTRERDPIDTLWDAVTRTAAPAPLPRHDATQRNAVGSEA